VPSKAVEEEMSKLSLAELTKLYSASNKPPAALEPECVLPGSTTLEKLSKLFFSRESCKLFAAPSARAAAPSSDIASVKTIAICLVIVDALPHELIWREWMEQGNDRFSARLFIHAKHPDRIQSPWLRQFLLKGVTFQPEWNSPEVIRAMLAILGEALDHDAGAGRFVFGTESCIPIYPLSVVAEQLYAEDVSWLNTRDTPASNWENGAQFMSVDQTMIPQKAVWKTIPGWMMLNRRHAAEIVNLQACVGDDLVRAWGPAGQHREGRGVFAPEEMFFSTMLAILGYLRKGGGGVSSTAAAVAGGAAASGKDQVRRRMVTFAAWARAGEPNPITYEQLTPKMLADFRKDGCLFARKFAKNSVTLATWRSLVCAPTDTDAAASSASALSDAAAAAAAASAASAIPAPNVAPPTTETAAAVAKTTATAPPGEAKRKREGGNEGNDAKKSNSFDA